MKYEENKGYGEEKGKEQGEGEYHTPEYHTLYLKTQKHPKYENEIWTRKGDIEKRENLERCHSYSKNLTLETTRISHPKTPNNTRKHPTTHEDNRKHPKITKISKNTTLFNISKTP